MRIEQTGIPGCLVLRPATFDDARGRFVKVFHEDLFRQHGLSTSFSEEYYSVSRPGVVRGMHFQMPPEDHVKLVFCTAGRVLDAVVDLRRGSPTFGQHYMIELSAETANMLYVPRGLAHGFYVPAEPSTMVYMVETVHSPQHDRGIAWNGCGVPWPVADPILSARDREFPALEEFESPFTFDLSAAT